MTKIDNSKPMNDKQIKLLQQVYGTFLYYAIAIDCTMLHALNNLTTKIRKGTQETAKALMHCLNYCATNPDAKATYQASDITQSFGCSILGST